MKSTKQQQQQCHDNNTIRRIGQQKDHTPKGGGARPSEPMLKLKFARMWSTVRTLVPESEPPLLECACTSFCAQQNGIVPPIACSSARPVAPSLNGARAWCVCVFIFARAQCPRAHWPYIGNQSAESARISANKQRQQKQQREKL